MTQATFLWDGDDEEPAALVRLEGSRTESEVRDALEADVPRFQDLLAVELSHQEKEALWLIVSRHHEERLHQNPESWPLLVAGLVPLPQGTVVVPAAGLWTLVTRAGGITTHVRRTAWDRGLTPSDGPFVLVGASIDQAAQWRAAGLTAKVLPTTAVLTAAVRTKLNRQLDQAAETEFPVIRLAAAKPSGALAFVAVLAVLAAVNVVLAWGLPEPEPAEPAAPMPVAMAVDPPRPSLALYHLAGAVPDFTLKEFRMTGSSWRVDFQSANGLAALDALRKLSPNLKVVQFQTEQGGARVLVEGEGYP